MTVDKVVAKIIWLTFFGPPCICSAQFSDGYFWRFLWWFYWHL